MTERELIFDFSSYGGHCPKCKSTNTVWWIRETEVPDQYNHYQEWYSCQDCKHNWEDNSAEAAKTYLRNQGYTTADFNRFDTKLKKLLKRLQGKDTD